MTLPSPIDTSTDPTCRLVTRSSKRVSISSNPDSNGSPLTLSGHQIISSSHDGAAIGGKDTCMTEDVLLGLQLESELAPRYPQPAPVSPYTARVRSAFASFNPDSDSDLSANIVRLPLQPQPKPQQAPRLIFRRSQAGGLVPAPEFTFGSGISELGRRPSWPLGLLVPSPSNGHPLAVTGLRTQRSISDPSYPTAAVATAAPAAVTKQAETCALHHNPNTHLREMPPLWVGTPATKSPFVVTTPAMKGVHEAASRILPVLRSAGLPRSNSPDDIFNLLPQSDGVVSLNINPSAPTVVDLTCSSWEIKSLPNDLGSLAPGAQLGAFLAGGTNHVSLEHHKNLLPESIANMYPEQPTGKQGSVEKDWRLPPQTTQSWYQGQPQNMTHEQAERVSNPEIARIPTNSDKYHQYVCGLSASQGLPFRSGAHVYTHPVGDTWPSGSRLGGSLAPDGNTRPDVLPDARNRKMSGQAVPRRGAPFLYAAGNLPEAEMCAVPTETWESAFVPVKPLGISDQPLFPSPILGRAPAFLGGRSLFSRPVDDPYMQLVTRLVTSGNQMDSTTGEMGSEADDVSERCAAVLASQENLIHGAAKGQTAEDMDVEGGKQEGPLSSQELSSGLNKRDADWTLVQDSKVG